MGDEGEEAPVAACLKPLGMTAEGNEILFPDGAAVHGGENAQDVQCIIDVPEQTVHPHIPGCGPQAVEGLQKRPAVLPVVCGYRVVEVAGRRSGADLGQPVRREAEHRRAQHRDQGHILPGIVDDLQ